MPADKETTLSTFAYIMHRLLKFLLLSLMPSTRALLLFLKCHHSLGSGRHTFLRYFLNEYIGTNKSVPSLRCAYCVINFVLSVVLKVTGGQRLHFLPLFISCICYSDLCPHGS